MASLTQGTWVWKGSGNWWRTGKPGVLQATGSQRVRNDWVTELNGSLVKQRVLNKCFFLHMPFFILKKSQKPNRNQWLMCPIVFKPGFPGGTSGKEPACQCRRHREVDSIPGLGRSPRRGHGNPPQYFCLKNSMERGAWWATVHRVSNSQTQLKQLSMHAHSF